MSLENFQIRAALTEGIGRDMEKSLEEARIKVFKFQGAYEALRHLVKIIGAKSVTVRDDLFAGKIVLDKDDTMATAKFVVAKLQEMVAEIHEYSENANINSIAAEGEVKGLQSVVKHMKSLFDAEVKRINETKTQIASGKVVVEDDGTLVHVGEDQRIPGTHPGPSLKMQRMEEAEAISSEEPQPEKPIKTRVKRRKS